MNYFTNIYRILFPVHLNALFSDEAKEKAALSSAARFSRGNENLQNERVTTERKFAEEMKRMEQRVALFHSLSH